MKLNLFENRFYKDVLTLIGGTGFAQLFPILISPFLTRLFSPSDFGLYAFYTACIAIIAVGATGRYELALLLPKSHKNAKNLAVFSCIIVFAVSLITFIFFFFFEDPILSFFGFETYSYLIYIIPFGIMFLALFQIFNYLLNRLKIYEAIALAKITRSFGAATSQVGFGILGFTVYGLVFGKLIGDFFGVIYAYWHVNKNSILKSEKLEWQRMKFLGKKYNEFPKINTPHALTNTSSSNLPNFMLAGLFSTSIAGYYNLSHRICFAPIQLISNSVNQVFSRSVTERYNNNTKIRQYSKSILMKLSLIAILPFSLLLFFGPMIFEFVFGSEWGVAGIYAQILTPFLYFVFITSPFTYIPILLDQQRKAFIIDIIYLALRSSALLIGFLLNEPFIAIASYSLVGVLIQSYLLYWIFSLIKNN